jgi:hypothetical protein
MFNPQKQGLRDLNFYMKKLHNPLMQDANYYTREAPSKCALNMATCPIPNQTSNMSDNNGGFKLKRGEKFQKELVTSMSDNL